MFKALRNIKPHGFVLTILLVLGTTQASEAVAQDAFSARPHDGFAAGAADALIAEKYPVAVTGHQEGSENLLAITEGKFNVSCSVATYEGTLEEESATITAHPHYEGCSAAPLGVAATVDLNGCDYVFAVGETATEDDIHGSATIGCPEGKQIEVTLGGLCTIDIAPQAVNGITYTNKPAEGEATPREYVTADVSSSGIGYTETKNTIFCPFTNNFKGSDGAFNSSVQLKGYEDLGSHGGGSTGLSTDTEGQPVGIDIGA